MRLKTSGLCLSYLKSWGGEPNAENISAEKASAQQGTWLYEENEDAQRPKSFGQKTRQGQSKTFSLKPKTACTRS